MADGAYGTRHTHNELVQMAEEFDRGDYAVVPDRTAVVRANPSDTGTAVLSVRLPRTAIAALKEVAQREGVGATVLARRWLLERLASQEPSTAATEGTVNVVELLEWLQTKVDRTRSAGHVAPERGARGDTATGNSDQVRIEVNLSAPTEPRYSDEVTVTVHDDPPQAVEVIHD